MRVLKSGTMGYSPHIIRRFVGSTLKRRTRSQERKEMIKNERAGFPSPALTPHKNCSHPTAALVSCQSPVLGTRSRAASYFLQRLRCITELGQADVHLLHHREIKPAHLALGFLFVVEHAAACEASTGPAEHHYRQLRRVVVAGEH